jgi:hypothetical protein
MPVQTLSDETCEAAPAKAVDDAMARVEVSDGPTHVSVFSNRILARRLAREAESRAASARAWAATALQRMDAPTPIGEAGRSVMLTVARSLRVEVDQLSAYVDRFMGLFERPS